MLTVRRVIPYNAGRSVARPRYVEPNLRAFNAEPEPRFDRRFDLMVRWVLHSSEAGAEEGPNGHPRGSVDGGLGPAGTARDMRGRANSSDSAAGTAATGF